ncbi:MAG: GNAT family N-acetyltransferase [Nocardioidaceae bacterium]
MARRIVSLTLDNVDLLPDPCRSCVFWEQGEARVPDAACKEDWLARVLLEWGSCGRIVLVDGEVAGFALYAPGQYVVGALGVRAGEVSVDAVQLITARIAPEHAASGLGRVLVQAVVKDAIGRREVKAIEAYADLRHTGDECVLPAQFLTAVGFKTVQQHPRYPRLRLELRSVATWRGELEAALERWLGAIRPEKGTGPVGVSPRSEPTHE